MRGELKMSKDVYVIAEQRDGKIQKVGVELIGEATKLAADLGEQVVAVLLGSNVTDRAQELISYGADKVIVVDEYGDVKIIGVFIARRIVADLFAVLILALEFRTALVNIKIAAGHVCKVQNIRVGFHEISGPCHHEFPRILVKKHFSVRAECSGRMECRDLFLILLPVGKLCPDFFDGAVAPVREPRGELSGAVFAEISVFQLAVSK